MSLKAFHILFISIAALMILACGAGALWSYLESGAGLALTAAIAAVMCVLGLAAYEVWFIRKTKGVL